MNWLFRELVEVSLGNRLTLSRVPTDSEWEEAYEIAAKHAVIGLLLTALEKINKTQNATMPPKELLYQWMGEVLNTETQNKKLNEAAEQLTRIFKNGGLRSCVLKGQGIARAYPQPLRRQSGDIDLWVEGKREDTIRFLHDSCFGTGRVVIHHVDARMIEGVETEIHFIPVYAYNPVLHYKLQRFFKEHGDEQFSHYDDELGFSYPTNSFNAVYVLAHIYMHFLYEGIGLRQLIDYYYVLNALTKEQREQATDDIKRSGLTKIAGAVMFVLSEVCNMKEELMIAKPDNKRGTLLLSEIERSGNFGKYDERLKNRDGSNRILFNLVALKRQLRFLKYFPMDVISIPFFKTGHWCWRKMKGYL